MPAIEKSFEDLIAKELEAFEVQYKQEIRRDHHTLNNNPLGWRIIFLIPLGTEDHQQAPVAVHIVWEKPPGHEKVTVTMELESQYSPHEMQTVGPHLTLIALFIERLKHKLQRFLNDLDGM